MVGVWGYAPCERSGNVRRSIWRAAGRVSGHVHVEAVDRALINGNSGRKKSHLGGFVRLEKTALGVLGQGLSISLGSGRYDVYYVKSHLQPSIAFLAVRSPDGHVCPPYPRQSHECATHGRRFNIVKFS